MLKVVPSSVAIVRSIARVRKWGDGIEVGWNAEGELSGKVGLSLLSWGGDSKMERSSNVGGGEELTRRASWGRASLRSPGSFPQLSHRFSSKTLCEV